jgi:hypothetical protein
MRVEIRSSALKLMRVEGERPGFVERSSGADRKFIDEMEAMKKSGKARTVLKTFGTAEISERSHSERGVVGTTVGTGIEGTVRRTTTIRK